MAAFLTLSTGRDYRYGIGYEYCIFDGELLVDRAGPFKTNAKAKSAGKARCADLLNSDELDTRRRIAASQVAS